MWRTHPPNRETCAHCGVTHRVERGDALETFACAGELGCEWRMCPSCMLSCASCGGATCSDCTVVTGEGACCKRCCEAYAQDGADELAELAAKAARAAEAA